MSRMKHAFVGVSIALFITNIAIASNWKENARAIDISGGEDHTLVLTADKGVWACGPNGGYHVDVGDYRGGLGTGNTGRDFFYEGLLVRVHDGAMVTESVRLDWC